MVHLERDTTYSFARIICAPVAGVENFGEVMILNAREALPPRPEETAARAGDDKPSKVRRIKRSPVR